MRALMWVNQGYSQLPGGHRIQMDRTAAALRALGVDVHISDDPDADLQEVDVVHGMGASTTMLRRARSARIPVAVSTIYCSKSYALGRERHISRPSRLNYALRGAASTLRRGSLATAETLLAGISETRSIFETADLLLPNSKSEAAAIQAELAVSTPMHVVPNGIDARVFTPSIEPGTRAGVLYAARIDPHKNQLSLIRALAGTGVSLTLVGDVHPHHKSYLARCLRVAGDDVTFLGPLDQSDLVSLYQRAAVHAMPSWCETTGLSSLEAAAAGAAIVTTNRGHVRDYFAELAEYCSPADVRDIQAAVFRALAAGPSEALRHRVLSRYTWDHAAKATLAAYRQLLGYPKAIA